MRIRVRKQYKIPSVTTYTARIENRPPHRWFGGDDTAWPPTIISHIYINVNLVKRPLKKKIVNRDVDDEDFRRVCGIGLLLCGTTTVGSRWIRYGLIIYKIEHKYILFGGVLGRSVHNNCFYSCFTTKAISCSQPTWNRVLRR